MRCRICPPPAPKATYNFKGPSRKNRRARTRPSTLTRLDIFCRVLSSMFMVTASEMALTNWMRTMAPMCHFLLMWKASSGAMWNGAMAPPDWISMGR